MESIMKGEITSYLEDKRYGFIKGEDGKDYFFHVNSLKDASMKNSICQGSQVTFTNTATPKGYAAKEIAIEDYSDLNIYVTPDMFIASKSSSIQGWNTIETGYWIVHGTSDDSPEAAKRELIKNAKRISANAVINLEYYKTTGSSGNYQYTVHNFKATPIVVGKKHIDGTHSIDDLSRLNNIAKFLKENFNQTLVENKSFNESLWMILLLLFITSEVLIFKFYIRLFEDIYFIPVILFLLSGLISRKSTKDLGLWLEQDDGAKFEKHLNSSIFG